MPPRGCGKPPRGRGTQPKGAAVSCRDEQRGPIPRGGGGLAAAKHLRTDQPGSGVRRLPRPPQARSRLSRLSRRGSARRGIPPRPPSRHVRRRCRHRRRPARIPGCRARQQDRCFPRDAARKIRGRRHHPGHFLPLYALFPTQCPMGPTAVAEHYNYSDLFGVLEPDY